MLCNQLPGSGRHYRFGSPEGNRRKRGPQAQAIGRSRGGLTTKIVALVDALGNLVRFLLLPGQAHDMKGVAPLILGVSFGALLAPSRRMLRIQLPGNGQGF